MTSPPPPGTHTTKRSAVAGVIAAVVLLGIGVAAVLTKPNTRTTAAPVPLGPPSAIPTRPAADVVGSSLQRAAGREDLMLAARTRGDGAAPVAIYEVADFQCPACRTFWEQTLPGIEREYVRTGKVKITFINFPIPSIHRNANAAHVFAMCAAAQNRFWQVHDLLYAKQAAWAGLQDPASFFLALGDSAGLSRAALQDCQANGQMRSLVDTETRAAYASGVKSTPTFIVSGALLAGAAPLELWRPILDSIFTVATATPR
jgi:protein-disulfide isomerase